MPTYLPFDPEPRPAREMPPMLACDSQFHVLGPRERYPVRPGAVYEMPTATIEAALRMHRVLGITRGIIVQPTTYGADHSATLDGLKVAGAGYKACANAIVFNEADDAYIAKLDAAGVKGARFTRAGLGVKLEPKDFERAIARVRELGWYVKVQPETDGFAAGAAPYETLKIPVIIDHMGRPDVTQGLAEPTVRKVVELLKRGNFWVMLSLVEKTSKAGPPWDDVLPVARAYIEAAPDRIIWGSDWPHPVSVKQPPNEGDLLDFLTRCAPDPQERQRILVDNPAKLFGFSP
ncbi:MAG: amidohydrolase family protein [Hyphomicrobiaceae bacterium]|nr:amidohydrolase family protein [Hyphomicrobiaceae bacterium]